MIYKRKLVILFFASSIFYSCVGQMHVGRRIGANNAYGITTPDMTDSSLIRFELRDGDYAFNGSRCEVSIPMSFARKYEFYFRAIEYKYEGSWFSLCDWHQSGNVSLQRKAKGLDLSPPLALRLVDSTIRFIDKAEMGRNYAKGLMTVPLLNGWNYVNIIITWSDKQTGRIKININGYKKVFNNIKTTYNMSFPNFFKFGIYRNAKYKTTSIIEFRDVKVDNKRVLPNFDATLKGYNSVKHLNGIK